MGGGCKSLYVCVIGFASVYAGVRACACLCRCVFIKVPAAAETVFFPSFLLCSRLFSIGLQGHFCP